MRFIRKCKSTAKLTQVKYENYPYLLTQEIENRQEKNRKLQEDELWYLVQTMADVGTRHHNANMKVGTIAPNQVFLNDDGQLKLATQFSWPD